MLISKQYGTYCYEVLFAGKPLSEALLESCVITCFITHTSNLLLVLCDTVAYYYISNSTESSAIKKYLIMSDVAHFTYKNHGMHIENLSLSFLGEKHGTPLYVYSKALILKNLRTYKTALANHPGWICYAVKANSNLSILKLLAEAGAGFDVVSGGEIERVKIAGGDMTKTVFSGVGKESWEIRLALESRIGCLNVESLQELTRIRLIARQLDLRAPVSLRVNPDIDAMTHPYISTGLNANKFGIPITEAEAIYIQFKEDPFIELKGIDCHIGSQIRDIAPLLAAYTAMMKLVDKLILNGIQLKHFDIGGGVGIRYSDETTLDTGKIFERLIPQLEDREMILICEPGRSIVGDSGVLLTRVIYLKTNGDTNFAVVDASMTELVRPALYNSYHRIESVILKDEGNLQTWNIVGPACETADFLGHERCLTLQTGDLLCIRDAGAYGFSMSSNYNSRVRPAEILIDGDQHLIIRERETIKDNMSSELKAVIANSTYLSDINQIMFGKMHSLGNDFVVIELITQGLKLSSDLVRTLSNRQTGIGFDQLITLERTENSSAQFRFRVFNSDGSEVNQCVNGARCAGFYLKHTGLSNGENIVLENRASSIFQIQTDGDEEGSILMQTKNISTDANIINHLSNYYLGNGTENECHKVMLGGDVVVISVMCLDNPHAMVLVDDITNVPLQKWGKAANASGLFPNGINFSVVELLTPSHIIMRVYERGVGETRACGSAAIASFVTCRRRGFLGDTAVVSMPGGNLVISSNKEEDSVCLSGPVKLVFVGEIEI